MIGNHCAADRLGGMRRPPAGHDAAFAVLMENVPERFAGAAQTAHRTYAHAVRSGLDEAVNAVPGRPLTGGDGSPECGTERRIQSGDITAHTLSDDGGEMRHFAAGQQRFDYFPVGGVPTGDQEARHVAEAFRPRVSRASAAHRQRPEQEPREKAETGRKVRAPRPHRRPRWARPTYRKRSPPASHPGPNR